MNNMFCSVCCMKFVTIFGLCKSPTELITEMFGVNLTFGDADGEPLSFSSLPFSLPSDNLMRLLKCFKKEAGAYLDESTATKLDVMLAPAPKLPSRKNKKGTEVSSARGSPTPLKDEKKQSTSVEVI